MENITESFSSVFVPFKGMVLYRSMKDQNQIYVESYDINKQGRMVGAHPLSETESEQLAQALIRSTETNNGFLHANGLLPRNLLHILCGSSGHAIWYTGAMEQNLFFVNDLGIPSGSAMLPPMIWKATQESLEVFAIKDIKKLTAETSLYYAPYFNVYKSGDVCMGTVDIDIESNSSLEEFISTWQTYFFDSKFSHLVDSYNPVSVNIVELWQNQVKTKQDFPLSVLKSSGKKLKDILK